MPNDTHSTKLADALADIVLAVDYYGAQSSIFLGSLNAARNALATYRAGDGTRAMPEWQPIETAPKDGTWVLACGRFQRIADYPTVIFWDEGWQTTNDGATSFEATHWMPLPAYPEIPLAASPSPSTEPAQAQEGQS